MVSQKELIEDYFRVKRIVGGIPSSSYFIGSDKLSEYCVSTYCNHFGSWKSFIREVEEVDIVDDDMVQKVIRINPPVKNLLKEWQRHTKTKIREKLQKKDLIPLECFEKLVL